MSELCDIMTSSVPGCTYWGAMMHMCWCEHVYMSMYGGARGVMAIVVGIGHGDTSSNPGRDWLHFT